MIMIEYVNQFLGNELNVSENLTLAMIYDSINWPALSVWVFIAQAGRALQR